MLLDADIYVTVCIISHLVPHCYLSIAFTIIHETRRPVKTGLLLLLWMQTGDLGTRLHYSQAPLHLLGHILSYSLRPKTDPSVDHFQHSGNETSLLPHIKFTLTSLSIVLCVIVNTCKPNNNLASYLGSSPEKHFSGEEPGYETNKNQSDLEKRKSYKTLHHLKVKWRVLVSSLFHCELAHSCAFCFGVLGARRHVAAHCSSSLCTST